MPRAVNDLKDLVRSNIQQPAGRIRIGTPPSFGAVHLAPAIQRFLEIYPQVQISLQLDYGQSDLSAENLDLTVRISPRLRDSRQVAYKIAVVPQVLVATKKYLEKAGTPLHPNDLKKHNCLVHTLKAPIGSWDLYRAEDSHSISVRGTFNSNLGESLLCLAKRSHGISMHPRYMVETLISQGSLQVVLPDYRCEGLDIYAIVQSRRYLPHKVRLFVDHLRSWFQDKAWLDDRLDTPRS